MDVYRETSNGEWDEDHLRPKDPDISRRTEHVFLSMLIMTFPLRAHLVFQFLE